MTKICNKCGIEKPISEFYKNNGKSHKDGLATVCKVCGDISCAIWRKKHVKQLAIINSRYRKKYPNYHKEWYIANPGYNKQWRSKNPDKVRTYKQRDYTKIMSNVQGKLNHRFSSALRKSLNINKDGRHWETLVGYTIEELKRHLESKFLSGMTWDNYGMYGWHIDHKIPKSFFEYTNEKDVEFQYCWSLDNLQPMWAKDNLSKGKKV